MLYPSVSKNVLYALAACLFFANVMIFRNMVTQKPNRNIVDVSTRNFLSNDSINESGLPNSGTQYGKIVRGTDVVILYNAVPKTGSRTFEYMVREYKARRNRNHIKPHAFPQNLTNDIPKMETFLSSLENGSFVRGHFPYTTINRTDTNVVYINSVREPIQRIISNYYFDIFGDKVNGDGELIHHNGQDDLHYHEKTIDECISKQAECFNYVYQYYKRQTFYILCGTDPVCRSYDRKSLEVAKRNVDTYLFIGEAKTFDKMIAVSQELLPDYFLDFVTVFNKTKQRVSKRFHTSRKISPTKSTVEFLKKDLHLEIELYEYIMHKFRRLQESLGV